MASGYEGTCWEPTCGKTFRRKRYKWDYDKDTSKSPVPEYCSGKCRQKAYRRHLRERRR